MGQLKDHWKEYLLKLKPEDITFKLVTGLFADSCKVADGTATLINSQINTYDTFTLKKGEYINKTDIETNAGRFIYNKLVVERLMAGFGDYVNLTLTDKVVKGLDDVMSKALLNDKINADQFIQYLDLHQWLGLSFTSTFCSSFTKGILTPNPKVIALRDKLYKENAEAIEAGDAVVAANIEKACIALAKQELDKDDGMLLYKPGARGSFDNNYKNISITKGPIFNPSTGTWDIMKNNFMEGIRKEDLAPSANSVITGAYPKAIGQRTFGYFTKQITAAMQSVVLDKPGSDCGTKQNITVTITNENKKLFLYRWIVESGKLKVIDDSTIDSYVGKTVSMRSGMYCLSKKGICSVCAGQIYEKLGIENIGLTASRVSSTMSNASMKKFHDTTAKVFRIKAEELSI